MDSPDRQVNADNTEIWPELEAVLRDIEQCFTSEAAGGDPTAPWEEIDDKAVVTMSGALFKALCEITAKAEGAMEWGSDSIILHSGMSAPVPLRFHVRPPLS
jgi:hypothetical protein